MKIINLLTRKHLKENKERTLVTILGIIISVAMITAVCVTITSFFDFFGKLGYISDGKGEVIFYPVTEEQITKLREDERVAKVGRINTDDETSGYTLAEGTTMHAKRGSVYTGDSVNLWQMVSCTYDGKLPENGNEIAVEQSLLETNKLELTIGDRLTMDLGRRTWINGKGEEETYLGGYQSEEKFIPNGTKTFTITAILHGNRATQDYKILRGTSEEELSSLTPDNSSVMISLKHVDHNSYREIMRLKEQYGIQHCRLNTEYLDSKFCLRKGSAFVDILPLISFAMLCIIIFSVILIYNAFGMSLAERVKYLGMLASVGATKAQKRLSIYYEGFILGVAGIPIGILLGLAGIYITLKIVGARMLTSGLFVGIENVPGMAEIPLIFPMWILPCIIIISAFTIFIAALVPAWKASKIMPIDAIRQTNEIKVRNNKFKVPRLVRLLFGYEGELAYKNLKRNGRKGKVIIFSISASLVMFLGMNHFCNLFWEANEDVYNLPFDVFASVAYSEKDKFLDEISNIGGIQESFGIDMFAYEYEVGDEESPNMEIMKSEHFTRAYQKVFKTKMTLMLHLVSDEDFISLCESQGIDITPYFGNETNALLCNNVSYTKGAKEAFTEAMLGQKLFYDDKETHNPAEITIHDFVKWEDNPRIFGMYSKNTVIAIIPYSNYVKTVYGDNIPEDLCYSVGFVTNQHAEVYSDLVIILEEGGYHQTSLMDIIENQGALSTVLYVLEVFTYGFITLITLITITNILNTISTGVAQRRKEFAMLKSVGMTPKGFQKMIYLESAFYGINASLWGVPISIIICLGMNGLLTTGTNLAPNLLLYVISIVVIFALIWLAMLLSINKLKDDTIVEVLKEEIN